MAAPMALWSPEPPTVTYGDGAAAKIGALAADGATHRVLLVCGRASFEASGAADILPDLEQRADVHRWSGFSPNPDADDLVHGLKLMHDLRPDVVLGVGGGSPMDLAKLLCAFDGIDDADQLRDAIRSGDAVGRRACKLCLVPTTSGSGSEATHFAVVYIGEEKFSIGGAGMRADTVVLDPRLSLSGSAHQRATSGIDAVCQAIESLWAAGATDGSRRCARHALELLLEHIATFVNAPDAESARAMSLGSHLAGRAIDISKTTAAHALSYAITKRFGVDHGHAVALTLGAFIQAHAEAGADRLQDSLAPERHDRAIAAVLSALGASDGRSGRARFTALMEAVGLSSDLESVGITTRAEWVAIVDAVNVQRLGNNPVRFTSADLADLHA